MIGYFDICARITEFTQRLSYNYDLEHTDTFYDHGKCEFCNRDTTAILNTLPRIESSHVCCNECYKEICSRWIARYRAIMIGLVSMRACLGNKPALDIAQYVCKLW